MRRRHELEQAASRPMSTTSEIRVVAPRKDWVQVDTSAGVAVTTVAGTTTGSTSVSCTVRCTYRTVYNGTILWVYGKGLTLYEVIKFRLNRVCLGCSDNADANGDVVAWFKRSMPNVDKVVDMANVGIRGHLGNHGARDYTTRCGNAKRSCAA
jgi:hypothetical protein